MNLKQTVAFYNTVPNVIWSILNFLPVFIFCYQFVELKLIFLLLSISCSIVILPRPFLQRIQLSTSGSAYKKLGVHWVNKFTQNGEIINRMVRRRFPEYQVISRRKSSINKVVNQTYMFERFHFMLFSFFTLISIVAIIKSEPGWVLLITITNIIYNVYPCLLQQYIRIKLLSFGKRHSPMT